MIEINWPRMSRTPIEWGELMWGDTKYTRDIVTLVYTEDSVQTMRFRWPDYAVFPKTA